jgi:O-antigen ligase
MLEGLQVKNYGLRNSFAWMLVGVFVSACISFFVSFQAGVFLLFFLVVAWWVWDNSENGFLLFIVIAPVFLMLKITQTISTATLMKDVIILTLFLKLFLVPLLKKQLPYRRNLFIAPIVALVGWTTIEMFRANSLILGVLRSRDIILYMLLYFAVLYLPHNAKVMKKRLKWFLSSLVVVIALGLYQWFFAIDSAVQRFDPIREVWIPRLSSVMAHPSIFGQYLIVGMGLLGAMFLVGGLKNRWLYGLLGVIIAFFIYLTYSRAVWMGLVVAFGLMIGVLIVNQIRAKADAKKLWRYTITGSLVSIVVLVVLLRFTPVGVFMRSAFDPTYGSNEERLEFMVRLVAPMSNSEAIFGAGMGDVLAQNFRAVDLEVYDIAVGSARSVQLTKNRTLVDNQYLKTFVEMGLLGLLIYVWIYWTFLKGAWKCIGGAGIKKIIGLWALGFLGAFVVQGMFIDIWDIFPTNAIFWIIAAVISRQNDL